jgi:hypothetical protein
MVGRSGGGVERDYGTDANSGLIPGVVSAFALGTRTIATAFNSIAAPQDVWPGPTAEMVLPIADESWEVVSSSAADTLGGAGAEAVLIAALDSNRNELAIITQNLNGTTPVVLPGGATYFRLNAAAVAGVNSVGTRRRNQGDITIRVAGGGAVRGVMPAFTCALAQAIYTVPSGKYLSLYSIECQVLGSVGGTTRGADFRLSFRNPNGVTWSPHAIGTTDMQPYVLSPQLRIRVNAGFDFIIQCTYASANNLTVGIAWEGTLSNN